MKDQDIMRLAEKYRLAIETAKNDGQFIDDERFRYFPHACCGDTCDLLAEYLKHFGIETVYYCGKRKGWSHAWLVINDGRIHRPQTIVNQYPKELWSTLKSYGMGNPEEPIHFTKYGRADLSDGLIIDITGDQFEDYFERVYVGKMDFCSLNC